MKYRIVQKKYSNGKKYYIAQYMHQDEWETLSELGTFRLVSIRFSSKKSALKAIEDKARELRNEQFSCLVEEGNL